MRLTQHIGQLLYPPKCILCGKLLEKNETDLCHSCRIDNPECSRHTRKISFIADWAVVWYYENTVRQSILRFKFHRARGYAKPYGRFLAMALRRNGIEQFDCLTWVPTGFWRIFRRGYDQVELLAKALGEELGIPPVRLLKKVRHTRPQSTIRGEAARRANVIGAYTMEKGVDVTGKKILLLDDIITTGATISEAARILRTAGADEVYCGAVAMTRRERK